ncbi:ABC transporter substrate-binding protein [Gulosibacter molinativorax]|uniref:Amino acid ABC transporter substrate-binding protein n=1 Tax=Gulosibacter molinativorax TaxID=256821 RepID=A0ABT7C5Y5_9MICO|nr:ABC transporter substrate-binding protein [Gulosibacter molinativorax]MDJ1370081.1 amino acid ABC transporter substrate-binding protein [Gulosibacter molinativorax]QUY63726.1 Hypotetical protein [Gulosibacter molinativorax]
MTDVTTGAAASDSTVARPEAAELTTIRFACIDSEAAPLFDLSQDGGKTRTGYEPEAAQLVADELGITLEWAVMAWDDMIPAVQRGEADAVWCGQGIIPSRQEQVNFTRPYAVFSETVLVRAGDPARKPEDLVGYKVAAIEGSANMRLAETFEGAETVAFTGDDVFGDMIQAVRDGTVDAMVDDDVVTIPLGDEPEFDVAFTVQTRNPWGVGVAKDRSDLLELLDGALERVIADGRLEQVWNKWMTSLPYPEETLRDGRPS